MNSGVAGFLARLTEILDKAGVPYMVTGSLASTYYGPPRTTQDIDIVVALTLPRLRALVPLLPEDRYYLSEAAGLDALRRQGQFNVIDLETGWKADLIVRKRRAWSQEEFDCKRQARLLGVDVYVASPEDIVLAKLEWSKRPGSERQLSDVQGVLDSLGEELDWRYLERWAEALELGAHLAGLRR